MAPAFTHKALAIYHNKTLLEHALTRLSAPTENTLISCGPISKQSLWHHELAPRLSDLGINSRAVFDSSEQHQGPLAGILSGLQYCQRNRPSTMMLLVSPVDTPKQPLNLAQKLLNQYSVSPGKIIAAQVKGRIQPLHSLWPITALGPLNSYLEQGERKVMAFLSSHGFSTVDFSNTEEFSNINTPDDLSTL